MNDLRKAAEMALKQLQREDVYLGHRSKTRADAITALRQALDLQTAIEKGTKVWADVPDATEWVDDLRGNTPDCKTHPDAPHGFDRNASHSADRYVCECEGWEPVDKVDMSEKRVHKLDKSIHEPVAWADKVGAVIPHSHKLFQPALLKDYTRPLYTAPYTKLDTTPGVLHKEWVDRLVRIMGTFDLATGHADTMDQALDALEEELRDVLGYLRARREWVGLTEDEFEKILETHNEAMPFAIYLSIEARLKEKNA